MRIRTACCAATLAAFCVFGQQRSVSTQTPLPGPYFVTDLGTLGGAESRALGLSEAAGVAGSAQRADGSTRAFFFSGTTLKDLGTFSGPSAATAANRSGAVVGYSMTAVGNQKAFVYTNATGMRSLRTLGGSASAAFGINDVGDIVGSAQTTGNAAKRAFIYRDGVMTQLGGTFGGTDSEATAISQSGEVAGWAATAGNASTRAFFYSAGVTTNLGTLGGASVGAGLNNLAEVVGHSVVASGARHAFLYSGGAMTDLGTLGGANSEAAGINDWSQVVGTSDIAGGGRHAFLYANGRMIDLNTVLPAGSGWVLEAATATNFSGEIVGYGRIGAQRHAFLLEPPALLEVHSGGTFSNQESNLPRDGVQAGRRVTFVTTAQVISDGTARNVVVTDTMAGPLAIERARSYSGRATCQMAANTVTCRVPAIGIASSFAEEIWVDARVTGPGAFSHTAHATADNVVPDRDDTTTEHNIGIALADFALSAPTVAGGKAVSGKATLTSLAPPGGAVVSIVSSNPAVVPTPSQLIVELPTATRTFNIVPAVVSQPTTVTITATYGLVTISRTLTVLPPALSALSLTRSTIIGACQTATAKVTLTGSAPAAGAHVALATTTGGVNSPASITVPAGATSASLTITANAVSSINNGTYTASFGGVSKGLSLSVRPIYVQSVVLTPSTVAGGGTVSGRATIECAAPAGGLTVALSSTNPAIAAPATSSLVLPAGAATGTFSVGTTKPAAATTVTIKASAHAVTKNAALAVTP